MSPCARACCWSPYACASARACTCHHGETHTNEPRGSDARTVRDPTANQAIRNIMAAQRKKPR